MNKHNRELLDRVGECLTKALKLQAAYLVEVLRKERG